MLIGGFFLRLTEETEDTRGISHRDHKGHGAGAGRVARARRGMDREESMKTSAISIFKAFVFMLSSRSIRRP
jgi:hypothetical protein